jgi:predicted amidohydrolase
MKIAAAAYPLEWHDRWNDYVGKLRLWVRTAAEEGAELLVFPEYGAMELASLAGDEIAGDLARSIDAVAERMPDVDGLHASLAKEFGVHICGASAPVRREDGAAVNRARLFAPDGSSGYQDKLLMTRFEREDWGISQGDVPRVFDTALGRIGILICYDAEFPLVARAMVEAGADILLVPSCTETLRGYWRVRVGAQARALENQCVTVQAPTVGDASWSPAVDENVGAAGIFGPPDKGFPDNGALALGKMNESGWVYAEVSREAIAEVRADGTVFNHRQWAEQDGPGRQRPAVHLREIGRSGERPLSRLDREDEFDRADALLVAGMQFPRAVIDVVEQHPDEAVRRRHRPVASRCLDGQGLAHEALPRPAHAGLEIAVFRHRIQGPAPDLRAAAPAAVGRLPLDLAHRGGVASGGPRLTPAGRATRASGCGRPSDNRRGPAGAGPPAPHGTVPRPPR